MRHLKSPSKSDYDICYDFAHHKPGIVEENNDKSIAKVGKVMYSKEQELTLQMMHQLEESLQKLTTMESRIERWAVILERAKIDDLLHNYANPKRLIFLNILSGLARGLGLTIGTAIVIAFLGYVLNQFISLPIIGGYIAELLDTIHLNRQY